MVPKAEIKHAQEILRHYKQDHMLEWAPKTHAKEDAQKLHKIPGQVMYKQMYLHSWDASGEAVVLLSSIWWN